MKLLLSIALLSLVLNAGIVVALNNLITDLLQDYPSQPNCDLQYVTDGSSKYDSLFSTTVDTEMNVRAVTLWKLSVIEDSFSNMATSSRSHIKCEMVFVDADQLLTTDFIQHIHSRGLLGQNHFYAIMLESVEILNEKNITEIFDFSHLVFLVPKVPAY